MNVIVMGGMGQVGSALCTALNKGRNIVYILDKKDDYAPPKNGDYDFLHVTIPYHRHFKEAVWEAIETYQPRYTVIHSTVPVGTTRSFGRHTAHSPVRGQHDSLESGVAKFTKYVGASELKTREAVISHFVSSGIKAEGWRKPEDTELMKLMCLSRYLNDLSFYEEAFKICRRFDVTPLRLIQWTSTYNDGYIDTKWVRPELTFPRGIVGGHCVMPVSKMLTNQTRNKWLQRNIDLFEPVKSRPPRKLALKNPS